MSKFLGFGIAGYRSFGKKIQLIGPLGKLNLLAGPNNTGKSNILSFVRDHLGHITSKCAQGQTHALSSLDLPTGTQEASFRVAIPLSNQDSDIAAHVERLSKGKHEQEKGRLNSNLVQLLNSKPLLAGAGLAWITLDTTKAGNNRISFAQELVNELATVIDSAGNTAYGVSQSDWNWMWKFLTGSSGGSLRDHWIPECLTVIARIALPHVSPVFIPAFRQLTSDSQEIPDPSGKGLIHALAMLERPTIDRMGDQEKFSDIVRFVRQVVQVPDASIEIPHNRKTLHVRMNGRTLPIQNLGTGIHQVVVLAAMATLHDNRVLCLEEPEMNLHPGLQKHLVRYLHSHTTNQYLIATHSAHILDTEGAAVFMVDAPGGWTELRLARSPSERFAVCSILGYRASDLLQSNAVIWVEGPSDRLYILWWLRSLAPDLIEGIHFSIMFYGGRLLSRLTTADEAGREFIELRRLNRNLAVIMDSDKSKQSDPVGKTKERIVEEIEDQGEGFAWITECSMIENYLDPESFTQAVETLHPKAKPSYGGAQFQSPFEGIESANKIGIAEIVCRTAAPKNYRYDLEARLTQLVGFIRRSNPKAVVPS